MDGANRGLLSPGAPHHFNRTRGDAFRKAVVIAGRLFGMTAFDTETATHGQLRDWQKEGEPRPRYGGSARRHLAVHGRATAAVPRPDHAERTRLRYTGGGVSEPDAKAQGAVRETRTRGHKIRTASASGHRWTYMTGKRAGTKSSGREIRQHAGSVVTAARESTMDRVDRGIRKPSPVPIISEAEARARRAKAAEADSRRAKKLAEKVGFGDYSIDFIRQARGIGG